MFASLFLLAAMQLNQVVVPLGRPRVIERPRAPIETSGPLWAAACDGSDDWEKPAPPVRIHANTYYVGTCGIASVLVVGSQGSVLIDSGTEGGADLVAANIRRLGYDPRDVRVLLHSHEHFDHVGGMARLQQLTGAQLYASANAAPVLRSGIAADGDPQKSVLKPFAPARVDRVLRDGEEVRLGDLMLKGHYTKGHTHGAMSWQWVSCGGGVCRTIVYADSLSPVSGPDYRFSDHPGALEAFRASIAKVASLDCDIILTPHPSASGLDQRFALGRPLLETEGCKTYAAKLTKALDERLAKEAAAKK
ncbi:MAG TPA: subclass B3 metallo-beta-lactamase [Sphingomicrobium sp.]|jgi:metallo-beta-lactamase class B